MKNSTIRLVIFLAALCIIGFTITQIYWVRRAFDLKEAEFERTVSAALYTVAQQIYDIKNTPSPANNPVHQISTNYFIVMVNSEVDARLLEFLLQTEFEKRNIKADFEYGIYDCISEKMVYGNYVPLSSAKQNGSGSFPKWITQRYHFGVQFPNREAHLINQMGIWSFSSIVLLLVIIFFTYAIFVILKQKRLSEVQKDFINNMTHEFKTPISTISVSTEVLRDPAIVQQPDRLLNYVTIIQKENSRLKQQVERVLQMAQLDKDDIALKKQSLDLHTVLQESVQNIEVPLHDKQGIVKLQTNATQAILQGDKLHLTNVFTNLIDNAIKYCSSQPVITITTANRPQGIVVQFQDNGIGITSENKKRVFQKFYRVSTGNVHDVKGFGLGLSYVKTILEAHRGTITLQSEPGKGSIFSVYLPFT